MKWKQFKLNSYTENNYLTFSLEIDDINQNLIRF